MEDNEKRPGPLRIVKRASNGPIRPSGSSLQGADMDLNLDHPRRASAATDESTGSIREDPVAMQRSLSIPKKRETLPSRLDGGAGRFYTASASFAAGVARRRLNDTDSFGSGSEGGDVVPRVGIAVRDDEYEFGGRYSSLRSQYVQDGCHDSSNGGPDGLHQQPRPLSEHSSGRLYEDEAGTNSFQRLSLGGGGARVTNDDYRPQYYDPRSEDVHAMHSGPLAESQSRPWRSERPDECGRQPSISTAAASDRHTTYDCYPAPAYHSQSHAYGVRPVSSDALPTGLDLFAPGPFERAATAIPFESPYQSHVSIQHRQMDPPRNRFDRRLSQLVTKPESIADADPQILVPIVSVTPECRTVEGDVNSFWVAIELFAHITKPLDTGSSRDHRFRQDYRHASTSSFSTDDEQGLYQFGYISGMDIKILPSYQSEILEVIGKSPSLITLLPGSRRLMVVHVHLDTTKTKRSTEAQDYRPLSHNSRSDHLLEDLELQLGSTSQEYMQIQLTYSHSGFPKRDVGRDPTDRDGGCVEVRTTIETIVTALVMLQNSSSMWSPCPAPAGSPLVDIVAKHWGQAAAKEMAKRISTSIDMRMLRRPDNPFRARDVAPRHPDEQVHKWRPGTPENITLDGSLEEVTPRAAESQSQHAKKKNERQEVKRPEKASNHSHEQPKIPPRKPRKECRRASSTVEQLALLPSSSSHKRVSLAQIPGLSLSSANIPMDLDPPSPGCLLLRSKNVKLAPDGPRQPIPDMAPHNIRRPVGMDTANLQNLAHGASNQSLKSENRDDRMAAYGGFRSSSRSSTVSKRSGKWSWSGWFS